MLAWALRPIWTVYKVQQQASYWHSSWYLYNDPLKFSRASYPIGTCQFDNNEFKGAFDACCARHATQSETKRLGQLNNNSTRSNERQNFASHCTVVNGFYDVTSLAPFHFSVACRRTF